MLRWARVDSGVAGFSSPTLTMSRPCPICGSLTAGRPFLEFPGYQFYSDDARVPKRIDLRCVSCTACFAAYLDPVYTDLGFSILFSEADQSYVTRIPRSAEAVEWMQELDLVSEGVRVLDVGCYDGGFLAALPDDVKRMGVDIDPVAIGRARKRLGPDALLAVGDFERFEVSEQPDVITMFHVLEHLPRPRNVLAKLRNISGDRARLVVEVPVIEGRPTNDLVGLFTPQHTTHFSRHSLRECLAATGWKVIDRLEHPDYNGERVLCEPVAARASVAGDPEDAVRLRQALAVWHEAVAEVTARLTSRLGDCDRCLIWGGGTHLEHLYAATPMFQIDADRAYVVVDSDPVKQGRTWRGIDILAPSALEDQECAGVPLVVSSYGSQAEIAEAAQRIGVDDQLIVTLYRSVCAR